MSAMKRARGPTDCCCRSTGCAYVSSLVIILANMFQCDDLHQLEADQALTRQGLLIFSKLREASSWPPLHRLHSVVRELDRRATHAIDLRRVAPTVPTDEEFAVFAAGLVAPELVIPDTITIPHASPSSSWTFAG